MEHLIPLQNAFNELTASRSRTDYGEGYIPLSEIYAYCQMFGIDDHDERAEFVQCIRAMDVVYLEWRQQNREFEQKQRDAKK